MSQRLRFILPAIALALFVAIGGFIFSSVQGEAAPSKKSVKFGLVGEPWDPAGPAGGGVTRDRNEPNLVFVEPGQSVEFKNRSGDRHQVALYLDSADNLTNWTNITVLTTGLYVLNNGTPCLGGTCPTADILAIGVDASTLTEKQVQKGEADITFKFTQPGVYLALCNFRPHAASFRQSTFVVVREPDPRAGNDND